MTGTYAGNDWDNRDITGLGFRPKYVVVRCVSDGQEEHHLPDAVDAPGYSLLFKSHEAETNRIQALLSDGFEVGNDNDVNKSGETYAYFAWAPR